MGVFAIKTHANIDMHFKNKVIYMDLKKRKLSTAKRNPTDVYKWL